MKAGFAPRGLGAGRGSSFGSREQPPFEHGRTPTRELLRPSAYLTAVIGYPPAAATGEDLVTRRLKADAERLPLAGDMR